MVIVFLHAVPFQSYRRNTSRKGFFFFFIFIFDVMQTLINIKKFSKFYPDLSFYFLRFFFFPACSWDFLLQSSPHASCLSRWVMVSPEDKWAGVEPSHIWKGTGWGPKQTKYLLRETASDKTANALRREKKNLSIFWAWVEGKNEITPRKKLEG